MLFPRSGARATLVAAAALLAACDGGGANRARQVGRSRCPNQPDSLVAQAALAFVKEATPTPRRFLVAAGTDSALPDAGLMSLQNKGPTYLYPKDAAQQTKFRQQLAAKGDYPTLLVAYRGVH